MRFDNGTRTQLLVDTTASIDLTGATAEVEVNGTWFPVEWTAEPVKVGAKWTRAGRTTAYFAGPNATPTGATVLTLGRHLTRTRVTKGSDVLVKDSTPIDVV